MTTITKYVCDLCGETFEDENECEKHEMLEKFGYHSNNVVFFDENKKVISIDDILINGKEIWGIYVEDENAIPSIDELCQFCEIISPWSCEGGRNNKVRGLYLYDEDTYNWYLPADRIEELKREMKEYGVGA
jgi:hypothetical protein|nr:MAG TPA: Monocytic leukemia zinc finger protein finger, acetyl transferase, DNA [Caudoviricetes sp.]